MKTLLLGFVLIALGTASGAWAGNNTMTVTTAPPANAAPSATFTVEAQLPYVFGNDCGNRIRLYVSAGSCTGGDSATWIGSTWMCSNSPLAAVSYVITMNATPTAACVLKVEGTDTNVANGAPPTQTLTIYYSRTLSFSPTTPATAGTTATLSSTASVGAGTKTYTSSTPAVCTVAGTTVTYLTAGTCSLTASIATDGIYQVASAAANVTVAAAASALTLSSGATASVCSSLSVTLAARDSGGNLVAGYTGTVTLSTSTGHGTWSKTTASGTLTAGSDTGAATYTFVAGDGGDAVFALANTHADDLTISAVAGALSVTSGTIGFRENAFVITNSNSDIVAGRGHGFTATMWTKDSSTGLCAEATNYTGSKDLKAWISRDGSDPGGTAPTISGTSLANNVASANIVSGMSFAAGVCTFTLDSSDVGKYAVNLRDASGTFTNTNIDGASSVYVVRPFGFAINPGANATATTASGTAFKKAGQTFSTTVTAVQYAAGDDGNIDGIPDSGADLTNNSATASFNASTELTHTLALPAGGTDGTFSGGGTLTGFSSGAKTTALSYSEVGTINLSAVSNSYLGGAHNVTGSLLSVGRFYPDHFSLSGGTTAPFCSIGTDFTYMGQPFDVDFTLTAQNSSNATTVNYTGSFAKLDATSSSQMNYKAADTVGAITNLTPRLTMNSGAGSWSNGVSQITASLTLARSSILTENGPYTDFKSGVAPADTDSVVLNAFDLDANADTINDAAALGSMAMRYGRLALDNAVGSELNALAIPARFEYYNGSSGFVANTDDAVSCSASAIVTGNFTTANWNGSGAEPVLTASAGGIAGQMSVLFAAPVSGSAGSVDIAGTTVPAWLMFNWDQADAADEPPTAKAVFGINAGSAPVIYRREGYRN